MSDYWTQIDELIKTQKMPEEYNNITALVLCNDCEIECETPYHFLYNKCNKCNGYNTSIIKTY